MLIDYKNYVSSLIRFFAQKKWEYSFLNGDVIFIKNYTDTVTRKIKPEYLLNDSLFYSKVVESFSALNIPVKIINSIENKNSDTDFIIAGLQLANNSLKKDIVNHESFYSLQPVVRLTKTSMGGQNNNMLTSFINLCSVDINTSLDEYMQRVDQWISVFSNLSLHTSGFKLITKKIQNNRFYDGVPFYNGLKLKFVYQNVDIAVANLFTVNCKQGSILVSDFGSSYERVLGCINGNDNFFKPIYPSFQVLYGNYVINDRLRTAVLMCMSGITPSAHGNGQKLRNIIKEATTVPEISRLKEVITYYYMYYSKFINSKIELPYVSSMIEKEIEQQQKKIISGKYDKKNVTKSIDNVCSEIILKQVLQRQSMLTKFK